MARRASMDVAVRIDLEKPAVSRHLREMRSAAEGLTRDPQSIRVSVASDDDHAMLAEFTMPNTRERDVADRIGKAFSMFMPDYSEYTIWLSKPPSEKQKPRPRKKTTGDATKHSVSGSQDHMRDEYDFSGGVRGEYAKRFLGGSSIVILDPDLARLFPNSDAVNRALRKLVRSHPEYTRETESPEPPKER